VAATRGVPRVLRGVALAGSSAALAVAAHAAAGGSLPAAGPTVALTILLAGLGVALADRQRGLFAILAVVGCSQVGMHVLLSGHAAAAAGPSHPALMTALHALAALATAVLLTGAEGAVFAAFAVLRWLVRGAARVLRPLPMQDHRVVLTVAAPAACPPLVDVLLRRVNSRRGPPDLR